MPSIRIVTSTQARQQDPGGGGMVADGSMRGDDDVLSAPLSVLGLSVRASNALLISGFSTLKDVVALTEIELWRLPRVGRATLREIESKLSSRGLTLRPGPPRPKWK